jgi:hypothetical protein
MVDKKMILPEKSGWYWVLIDGYDSPTPCWFSRVDNWNDPDGDSYFLPGGMGDSSSMGLYIDDLEEIGPEIIVPKF